MVNHFICYQTKPNATAASIYIHSTEAVLYEKLRQLLCYSTILYYTILYDLLLS